MIYAVIALYICGFGLYVAFADLLYKANSKTLIRPPWWAIFMVGTIWPGVVIYSFVNHVMMGRK